jgi:hypothetical protein
MLGPVFVLALTAVSARAESFSTEPVFAFAPAPADARVDVVGANSAPTGWTENLKVRPNQDSEFYLYVRNPRGAEQTYLIDLRGPGSLAPVQLKVTLPINKWVRVRLPKPPAPPAPVVVVPPQPGAVPPPPPEPLPPGGELARTATGFSFTLRLLKEDGSAEILDKDGNTYGHRVEVTVQRPDDYVINPTAKGTRVGTTLTVNATVTPKKGALGGGTAVATLAFQKQALPGAIDRGGLYHLTLGADPTRPEAPVRLTGKVENAGARPRIYVGIDGIDRAYIYEPARDENFTDADLDPKNEPAVRVYPATAFKVTDESKPVAVYPVRVEADNDPVGATVELWVRQAGSKDEDGEAREVIRFPAARNERVWVDPAGKTDGGVLLTSKSRDWVKVLDLLPFSGKLEVIAVLKDKDGRVLKTRDGTEVKSAPLLLTVDATPPAPGKIRIENLSAKNELFKGRPLVVSAAATEPETRIEKAVFFIGQLTDDRKIPADAIKANGVLKDGVWVAVLPVPVVKPGEQLELSVSVVFYNSVGLTGDDRTTVILVDGPPPGGTIVGTVKIGEIPQGGAAVVMRNADGKEVGATRTAEKDDPKAKVKVGDFKFENVPPGAYTVVSAKQSSSYPFAAVAPAQVEVGKVTTVKLSMIKVVK